MSSDLTLASFQVEMGRAKHKSAYNSLIIGPRGWGYEKSKSWAGNLLLSSDLTLAPPPPPPPPSRSNEDSQT